LLGSELIHRPATQRQPERGRGASVEERSQQVASVLIGLLWEKRPPQGRANDLCQGELLGEVGLEGA
jgi:hypothetical protein